MIRIVHLYGGYPGERKTVAATRTRQGDIAYVQRLMHQNAEKLLLPGYHVVKDQTIIGGYYADIKGDCIIAENVIES